MAQNSKHGSCTQCPYCVPVLGGESQRVRMYIYARLGDSQKSRTLVCMDGHLCPYLTRMGLQPACPYWGMGI